MGKSVADKLLEDEFYDIPYEVQLEYKDKTIIELLEELEGNTVRTDYRDEDNSRYSYVEETYIDNKDGERLELLICSRLGLFRGYDLLQIINTLIYENKQEIKALEEKFKNHRHPLDRTYGDKPIY